MKEKMKLSIGCIHALALVLFLNAAAVHATDADLPEKGKEISINCIEFPAISYRLFIPPDYDPSKPCAIIDNLKKGLKDGENSLDPKAWIIGFGEGG